MGDTTKIVVLDGYTINPGDNPWTPVEELGDCTIYDRTPPELKLERAIDADVILLSKVKLDAAALQALPKFKYISTTEIFLDKIDRCLCQAREDGGDTIRGMQIG